MVRLQLCMCDVVKSFGVRCRMHDEAIASYCERWNCPHVEIIRHIQQMRDFLALQDYQ